MSPAATSALSALGSPAALLVYSALLAWAVVIADRRLLKAGATRRRKFVAELDAALAGPIPFVAAMGGQLFLAIAWSTIMLVGLGLIVLAGHPGGASWFGLAKSGLAVALTAYPVWRFVAVADYVERLCRLARGDASATAELSD